MFDKITLIMEYIVSARKYRPLTFDAVVGQGALTSTLKNSVKSGKLAHAYLFCGPRGVGKTTCARIFAKVINCENLTPEGDACGECESCKAFGEQRSFNVFELDAASNNGVEHIKSLMEQTRIPPQVGKYKVFIIDEVHMLSTAAFNAFLKTLEEPPAYVVFILATTEKHKLLPTIISRCQIYDFERMTVPNIVNHLKMVAEKEGVTYEEEALNIIAEKADGGMRDALSVFDQVVSFCQGNVTYEKVIEDLNVLDAETYFKVVDLSLDNKVYDIMLLLNQTLAKGFDGGYFINGLAAHLRNIMMANDPRTVDMLQVSAAQKEKFVSQAGKCSAVFLYKALRILNNCDINYRQSSNKRLLVELTLIEIAQITQPDEPGSGRRPYALKTLFKKLFNRQSGQVSPAENKQVSVTEMKQQTPKSLNSKSDFSQSSVRLKETLSQNAATERIVNTQQSTGLFSLSGMTATSAQDEAKEDSSAGVAFENAFTEEQLLLEWLAMCNRMPEDYVALATRLKNIKPVITEFPNIEIQLTNELLYNQIAAIRGKIEATMRLKLNNRSISLTLRMAVNEDVKPLLTQAQRYNELKQNSEALNELFTELNMNIVS